MRILDEILTSQLFDERGFYPSFINDIKYARNEVIIESPYLTIARAKKFYQVFQQLLVKSVKIYIVTKDFNDVSHDIRKQVLEIVKDFENMGVQVLLCTGNHHRKLAIIDREILWEGSLNILSHTKSREIMRRIESEGIAIQTFDFLGFEKYL